jgi:hypothetical protein
MPVPIYIYTNKWPEAVRLFLARVQKPCRLLKADNHLIKLQVSASHNGPMQEFALGYIMQ